MPQNEGERARYPVREILKLRVEPQVRKISVRGRPERRAAQAYPVPARNHR
jgi:hypothetical protein